MYLLIAIFLGLYVFGRMGLEKSKDRAYDERSKKRQSEREAFKEKYAADHELERWAKNCVLSGAYYKEICNAFSEDFEFVLGANWKEEIRIPPNDRNRELLPCNQIYWIYQLILARKGKIDYWKLMSSGLKISGIEHRNRDIKFAQRIEHTLKIAGVENYRLALELEPLNRDRPANHIDNNCGKIVLEQFATYPTYRLW